MKKIMIIAMVLFSTSALAEDKTITPKEFVNNVSQVPNNDFFHNEVEKINVSKKSYPDQNK